MMTVLFRDVYDEVNLSRGRLEGLDFSDLLYADDSALFTNNVNAMNRLLVKIEEHALYYGLAFNKTKCVSFNFHTSRKPVFADGTKVPETPDAVYLGGLVSKTHDNRQEVSRRISACFGTFKKLDVFWRRSNCPATFKIQVYDAVLRAKLLYGLESVYLTAQLKNRLNVFQLKGLRKILGMDTTYINRSNTNARVFQKASEVVNPNHVQGKNVKPFSVYLQTKQQSLLKHTVRAPDDDPLRQCTFQSGSAVVLDHKNKRVGRPRGKWAVDVSEDIYVAHGFGDKRSFRSNISEACARLEPSIRNRVI